MSLKVNALSGIFDTSPSLLRLNNHLTKSQIGQLGPVHLILIIFKSVLIFFSAIVKINVHVLYILSEREELRNVPFPLS